MVIQYMCKAYYDKMIGNCNQEIDEDDDFPMSYQLYATSDQVLKYCNTPEGSPACGVVKVEIKFLEDTIPQAADYPRKETGYKDQNNVN